MSTTVRRAVGVVAAATLALLTIAASAGAASPPGPRLAFLKWTERPDALTIGTSNAALGEPMTVAGGGRHVRPQPYPPSGPAWSPDGSSIAFSGVTGPLRTFLLPDSRQIYLVDADGAGIRAIPGTKGGFAPVFWPDGRRIAFAKTAYRIPDPIYPTYVLKSTAVWSVDLGGRGLRPLTKWESGMEDIPSSFSPDGSVLGLTQRDLFRDRADAVALRTDGSGSYVLSKNASWPRYAPDGARIAFLAIRRIGETTCCELGDGFSVDLFTMSADRTSLQRLTDTSAKAERPPSWDPSGERLVYTTRSAPTENASGDLEAAVMQINADGTCPSRLSVSLPRVRGHHVFFYGPTWQPGPGREVARIDC
jgi:TolB protein